MKFILLMLLAITINAQNIWYVSRDATGANTGRSWTDAWNYFDSSGWAGTGGINWAVLEAGDTIWVDGGSDSTAYYPLSPATTTWIYPDAHYDFDPPVVIRPSFESGRNGEVYITTREPNYYNNMYMLRVSGVTFQKFNFVERHDRILANASIYLQTERVTMDSCYFLNIGESSMLGMGGGQHRLINSVMDYVESDSAAGVEFYGFGISDDPIYDEGGHLVDNNTFILRNKSLGSGEHKDMAQMNYDGNDNFYTISVISNNLFIDVVGAGDDWNACLYATNQRNIKFLYYNNIIVQEAPVLNTGSSIIGIWHNGDALQDLTIQSVMAFNNTIILKADSSNGCGAFITNLDTSIFKNNLVVIDSFPKSYIVSSSPLDEFGDIDYNIYAVYGGVGNNSYFGSNTDTWAVWQETWDTNGDTLDSRDIVFSGLRDSLKTSYYTVTGRDAGVDIGAAYPELLAMFPNIAYDALGNPRGQGVDGKWDIGALEFQTNITRQRIILMNR